MILCNNNKTTKLLDLCTLNISFFIALKKIKNSKLCSSLKKNLTKIKNYSRVFFSRYLLRSEKIPVSRFKKNNKHAVVILGLYALCIKTVFMPREYVYFLLSKQPISWTTSAFMILLLFSVGSASRSGSHRPDGSHSQAAKKKKKKRNLFPGNMF